MHSRKTKKLWTEDETILALYLYFQIPFGQIHSKNTEIQQLAAAIGRTNSSVAMKLTNFASLDPKIIDSGRKGLNGVSKLDRLIYRQFSNNWGELVQIAEIKWLSAVVNSNELDLNFFQTESGNDFNFRPFQGASVARVTVNTRRGQDFFRRAVLANYTECCCITGIAEPQLLVASHIKPWEVDVENRHNPENGILLAATMDKAFDRGLISITSNGSILISQCLLESKNFETRSYFENYRYKKISPAVRFDPNPEFIEWHNKNCFIDLIKAESVESLCE